MDKLLITFIALFIGFLIPLTKYDGFIYIAVVLLFLILPYVGFNLYSLIIVLVFIAVAITDYRPLLPIPIIFAYWIIKAIVALKDNNVKRTYTDSVSSLESNEGNWQDKNNEVFIEEVIKENKATNEHSLESKSESKNIEKRWIRKSVNEFVDRGNPNGIVSYSDVKIIVQPSGTGILYKERKFGNEIFIAEDEIEDFWDY